MTHWTKILPPFCPEFFVYLKGFLVFCVVIIYTDISKSQSVPEHISNKPIYDFLDELANGQIIALTSVVKPYSRQFISQKLQEAQQNWNRLNYRQRTELERFLRDYALEQHQIPDGDWTILNKDTSLLWSIMPPVLSYRDSLFKFQLKPVYGIRNISNTNGTLRQFHGGVEAHAYIGNSWAFWASLRDHHHKGGSLGRPGYVNQEQGGAYKGGGDFSEMRAGVTYTWNWGMVALQKDHEMWGDNYNGANIFSGRTPSFAMVKLHIKPTKWLQLNFHHGWLVSEVIDSARTYITEQGLTRGVYRDKYVSANILTVTPFRGLDISAGNAFIYSDINANPAYLIPFMFYKSVDHSLSRGVLNQNSMMFFNISSRQIRHLHLYGSWFVDEFATWRITDESEQNFTSTKLGFRLSNWPLYNISFTAEHTFTYPQTFKHKNESTTFETNRHNLGHYLRGNARDYFFAVHIRPLAGLTIEGSWLKAQKGNLREYELGTGISVAAQPYMQDIIWHNETYTLSARYLIYNNFSFFTHLQWIDVRSNDVEGLTAQQYLNMFTPAIFHGKTTTLTLGFQLGF